MRKSKYILYIFGVLSLIYSSFAFTAQAAAPKKTTWADEGTPITIAAGDFVK